MLTYLVVLILKFITFTVVLGAVSYVFDVEPGTAFLGGLAFVGVVGGWAEWSDQREKKRQAEAYRALQDSGEFPDQPITKASP